MFWLFFAAAQLLGASQAPAWLPQAQHPQAARVATSAFMAIGFVVTAFKLGTGVAKAGSLAQEGSIHLLILGVPLAAARPLQWKVLS